MLTCNIPNDQFRICLDPFLVCA